MQVWINNQGPLVPESFERNVGKIDVTSALTRFEPDPAWRHVDDAGHFHAYTADGDTPTLGMVCADEPECPHDPSLDYCNLAEVCSICKERIEPGRIAIPPDSHRTYAPGRESWTLVALVSDWIDPTDPVSVRFVPDVAPDSFAIGRVILQEQDERFGGTRVTIEGGQRWEVLQP